MSNDSPKESWSRSYITRGVIACLGGMMLHLVIGSLYQWGIISIYVTSYYKLLQTSVTLEQTQIAFPLMQFSYGLTMRLGLYFAEKTHPIISTLTCIISLSAIVFISSFMTNIWAFIVLYGIIFGLLVGLIFMVPVVQCNKYFPGMRMYVNGCILAGTGLGSVVFSNFSYNYLDKQHIRPIEGYFVGNAEVQTIAQRVPSLIKYLALLYFCIATVALTMLAPVMLHNRRKQNGQRQIQQLKQLQRQQLASHMPQEPPILKATPGQAQTLKQVLTSKVCWIEVSFIILIACGMFLLNGNYKTYVRSTINDDDFLTIVGVLGSVANGTSRFVWNVIFVKTGYRFVMLCIMTIAITVYSTIRFAVYSKAAYLTEIFLINLCLGGLLVTTPTVVQTIFGQKMGSNIYGFFWCVIATGNWLQFIFVEFLSLKIGFNNVIYICLAMCLMAYPIIFFTNFQGPWMNNQEHLGYFSSCRKKTQNQSQFKNDTDVRELFFELQEKNQTIEKQRTEKAQKQNPEDPYLDTNRIKSEFIQK